MTQQEWFSSFRDVGDRLTAFLPTLLGAVLLALAGWVAGQLLAWLSRRLVRGLLTQLVKRPALRGAIEGSGSAQGAPRVIGAFTFWLVFVFFLAAAIETLGLPVVTASVSRIVYYLPNVLAALLVLFAGLVAAKLAGGAVTRAAAGTGVAFAPAIGVTVRGAVILVAVAIALEQVGIRADVLVLLLAVTTGAALTGAALAFGLGARTAVSNIIASHYLAQAYRVGQTVRIGGVDGKIIETTPTAVFVAGPEGRVLIPASQFSEQASVLLTGR